MKAAYMVINHFCIFDSYTSEGKVKAVEAAYMVINPFRIFVSYASTSSLVEDNHGNEGVLRTIINPKTVASQGQ